MSRRFWIVCLMLALLPLRGWAAASMTVPVVAHGIAVNAVQVAAPGEPTVPSCHRAAGDESGASGHACTLCDLCHGALADLAAPSLPQLASPDVTARPVLARDTGRHAVGGLDRPPRDLVA
jgi:cytochrome c553